MARRVKIGHARLLVRNRLASPVNSWRLTWHCPGRVRTSKDRAIKTWIFLLGDQPSERGFSLARVVQHRGIFDLTQPLSVPEVSDPAA